MKIYSDDGKEFKTTDECNAYESNLALQKVKEEEEKKKKAAKEKEQFEFIKNQTKLLSEAVKDYQKFTGKLLVYTVNGDGSLSVDKKTQYSYHDIFNNIYRTTAW